MQTSVRVCDLCVAVGRSAKPGQGRSFHADSHSGSSATGSNDLSWYVVPCSFSALRLARCSFSSLLFAEPACSKSPLRMPSATSCHTRRDSSSPCWAIGATWTSFFGVSSSRDASAKTAPSLLRMLDFVYLL